MMIIMKTMIIRVTIINEKKVADDDFGNNHDD